jgi:hypothetical protein
LHALLASLWPGGATRDLPERVTRAEIVTIALRTPRPTPRPRPTPTPPPPPVTPAPHYSLAPTVVVRAPAPKAAATPHRHSGGAAAPKRIARVSQMPAVHAAPVSLVAGTKAGEQNGGAGTGAGAGTGDGGLGGTGTGTGGVGNGNGGTTDTAPCGDVYLLPGALVYRKDGTVVQQVLAKIVERDGTVRVDRFPYPFVYPGEKANPFRHDDAVNADGGIPVQEPPAGADVSSMPASVQIVLKFTDPKTGLTSLPACNPSATPH